MSADFWVMKGRQASNDPKICMNDKFFPRIFKSRKVGNDICFIMTFFRIPVRKTSEENSHCNEENTVKMIQNESHIKCNGLHHWVKTWFCLLIMRIYQDIINITNIAL